MVQEITLYKTPNVRHFIAPNGVVFSLGATPDLSRVERWILVKPRPKQGGNIRILRHLATPVVSLGDNLVSVAYLLGVVYKGFDPAECAINFLDGNPQNLALDNIVNIEEPPVAPPESCGIGSGEWRSFYYFDREYQVNQCGDILSPKGVYLKRYHGISSDSCDASSLSLPSTLVRFYCDGQYLERARALIVAEAFLLPKKRNIYDFQIIFKDGNPYNEHLHNIILKNKRTNHVINI